MKTKVLYVLALALLLSACSGGESSEEQASQISQEAGVESAASEGTDKGEEPSDSGEEAPQATGEKSSDVSGTYTGKATGHNGPVSLEVTLENSKIKSVKLVENAETPGIGDVAFEKISKQLVEGQTLKIDTASGASVSFDAYKMAIVEALESAGVDVDALKKAENPIRYEDQDLETQVLVVGSGASGLSAAIEAAEGGAKVLVLEKLSRNGGSTRTSSGMVYVGGSDLQKEAGIEDSVDALKQYWMERAEGHGNEQWINFTADKANEALQFLIDSGIGYTPEGVTFSGIAKVARAHVPPTYGVEFVDKLVERAEKAGVQILTEMDVQELIMENGSVSGAIADHKGAKVTVRADAVILATGGFDHNEELKKEYAPDAAGAWAVSAPGNEGDGLVMGMNAGADTVFNNGVIGWKVVSPMYGHTTNVGKPIYGVPELIVNEEGKRFVDESVDYPFLFTAMEETGDETFYFIFDSSSKETVQLEATTETIQSLEAGVEAGVVRKADTVEALQEMTGLSELRASIDQYNAAIQSGEDKEFGRDPETMSELSDGPFYALQASQATLGSFGGLKTSLSGEILDKQGAPIPGLYAAGEVANGEFFYRKYPASGSSLTMCVVFGREAGISASRYVQKEK